MEVRALLFLLLPLVVDAAVAPKAVDAVQALSQHLDEEGNKDKEAHDKLGCWCETKTSEEKQVISDLQQSLTQLGHDIDAQSAGVARMSSELDRHEDELATNQQALDTAEALRTKEADKFAEEETSQQTSLSSLDDALTALKSPGGGGAALLQKVSKMSGHSKGSQSLLLQLNSQLRGHQSPDVVQGVLERMKANFADDLKDMQREEKISKERHEGLRTAKTDQINALSEQIGKKKQRIANDKAQMVQKKRQQETSQKLLDAHMQLSGPLQSLCEESQKSFEARQEERQAEVIALSEALTELQGATLISVKQHGMSQAQRRLDPLLDPNSGAHDLCAASLEVVEQPWRKQVKAACKQATDGQMQDAADAAEQIEEDLKVALKETNDDAEKCREGISEANAHADAAEKDASVDMDVASSNKEEADSTISSFESQGKGSQDAKTSLNDALSAQREVLKSIQMAATHAQDVLHKVADTSGVESAKAHLMEAVQHSEKLVSLATEDPAAKSDGAAEVSGLFDGVTQAANKALIPLRLLRADAEEDAISAKDEEKTQKSLHRGPSCNVEDLAAKAKKIEGYITVLQKAAESLAYEALR
eukprot:gnl/TRDRNA2_/TRDRNA2_130605_c0_seq3.p1 gnl/TRDRNA2_/TRDRNA2_130605_c0~~gnl/TRDRNA2_/TRDRNA2_130605_c0_seq3.p1  ORF type:complete len:593 (+),score=204.49 gnl/TRDRNA2_/TRDRNA2_130605_c0_seq3:74-1852(+)